MKSNRQGLTLFVLIAVGSIGLGLLLAVGGHLARVFVLIVVGAYIVGKLSSYLFGRKAGPANDAREHDLKE